VIVDAASFRSIRSVRKPSEVTFTEATLAHAQTPGQRTLRLLSDAGVVAIVLIDRNPRFLIGEQADSRVRAATLQAVLAMPEVARVTYLRQEIVGPGWLP